MRVDEKTHVPSGGGEPPAKVAADAARSDDQRSHGFLSLIGGWYSKTACPRLAGTGLSVSGMERQLNLAQHRFCLVALAR